MIDLVKSECTKGLEMTKPILLIPVISVLLGCGMFTQADAPVSRGESPPPVSVSSALTILFHGDSLIEQKILASPIVVRATMTALSSEVMADADGEFRAVFKFSLSVSEYLKGTGPSAIVALWLDDASYETRGEADVARAIILAWRDDQWDDRESIIFLLELSSGFGPLVDEQLRLADHFLLYVGDPYSSDDLYSLHSRENKIWLPAASSVGTAGDGQKFLLDVPGSGSTTPTITLGELKTRITDVTAEFNGGDGSEAYKACVRNKYGFERAARHFREVEDIESYGDSPLNRDLMSGLPARTMLAERNWYGVYPDIWAETWLEGRDGALFSVEQGEATPNDSNNDGVLTAGVDQIRYMESFLTVRPLPAGEYEIDRNEVWAGSSPCNYVLSYSWPVTVTAPAGVLHEAFFDPVTVGTAVEADSENGQLAPSSFDNSGVTTTLESLSYEAAAGSGHAGTVKLKLDPHDGLVGHVLDFIELDGTVSLSLNVLDASVDSVNKALSWSVTAEPWADGDQLMLRVRKATAPLPFATVVPKPTSTPIVETSLLERIAGSEVVARVEFASVRQVIETFSFKYANKPDPPAVFAAALEYTFTVNEYLKGSGGNQVVGLAVDRQATFPTRAEAEAATENFVSARDTQWDDREAIVFFRGWWPDVFGALPHSIQNQEGRYFLGSLRSIDGEDVYTIASRHSKHWLPATTGGENDATLQREYLLDIRGSSEGASTAPTITLTEMKAEVAKIAAEIAAGDGTNAYRDCIFEKYSFKRARDHVTSELGGSVVTQHSIGSGLPAGTRVNQIRVAGNTGPDVQFWLEGDDEGLFEASTVNQVLTMRPLPAGEYSFMAPDGVLHEAFFDPVTVGTAVKADSSNGQLSPSSFDNGGVPTTLESLSYEPPAGSDQTGTVNFNVNPTDGLVDHVLDFIELDGTVSLSLNVLDASVDSVDKTLSWSVTAEPWADGDHLMLRIRRAQ